MAETMTTMLALLCCCCLLGQNAVFGAPRPRDLGSDANAAEGALAISALALSRLQLHVAQLSDALAIPVNSRVSDIEALMATLQVSEQVRGDFHELLVVSAASTAQDVALLASLVSEVRSVLVRTNNHLSHLSSSGSQLQQDADQLAFQLSQLRDQYANTQAGLARAGAEIDQAVAAILAPLAGAEVVQAFVSLQRALDEVARNKVSLEDALLVLDARAQDAQSAIAKVLAQLPATA